MQADSTPTESISCAPQPGSFRALQIVSNIYGREDVGWQEQGHHAGRLALLVGKEGVLSHVGIALSYVALSLQLIVWVASSNIFEAALLRTSFVQSRTFFVQQ